MPYALVRSTPGQKTHCKTTSALGEEQRPEPNRTEQHAGLWHLPLQHIVAVHDRDNVVCRSAALPKCHNPSAKISGCHSVGAPMPQDGTETFSSARPDSVASTPEVEKLSLAPRARNFIDELVDGFVQAVASTFDVCISVSQKPSATQSTTLTLANQLRGSGCARDWASA